MHSSQTDDYGKSIDCFCNECHILMMNEYERYVKTCNAASLPGRY